VVYGLDQPRSRHELAAAIEDGTVESLLRRVPVKPGDVIFVPAGTMHAIDAGIMLFEIQQKSDLTYRVYDYGRRDAQTGQPRELHIDKALDVTDFAPPPRAIIPPIPMNEARQLLIACDSFALEGWTLADTRALATGPGTFEILTVIEGSVRLQWSGDALTLRRGDSVVLPASLGDYTLLPESQPAGSRPRLLRAYVPDLERDFVAPLRAQGIEAERIAASVAL
jgi:mannose-6-phosphate isomerase